MNIIEYRLKVANMYSYVFPEKTYSNNKNDNNNNNNDTQSHVY